MNDVCDETSHSKKLESKKKSIEEKYEIKIMQKEMRSSYKVNLQLIQFV